MLDSLHANFWVAVGHKDVFSSHSLKHRIKRNIEVEFPGQ